MKKIYNGAGLCAAVLLTPLLFLAPNAMAELPFGPVVDLNVTGAQACFHDQDLDKKVKVKMTNNVTSKNYSTTINPTSNTSRTIHLPPGSYQVYIETGGSFTSVTLPDLQTLTSHISIQSNNGGTPSCSISISTSTG